MRIFLALLASAFSTFVVAFSSSHYVTARTRSQSRRNLFDKVFEEEGPLGKGITVGKVQVALLADDRSPTSIFGLLERKAKAESDTPYALARMCYDVCMALLRKEDDWVSASSTSEWFKGGDAGKAESTFNTWADKEAAKFEKVRRTMRFVTKDILAADTSIERSIILTVKKTVEVQQRL